MEFQAQAPPKQASLVIEFVIVGGGLAGLACAVALRRVGHKVLVLEADASINTQNSGGVRFAPNLAKILYHWGLAEQLQQVALKSQAIDLVLFETGEVLGRHVWDQLMLKEARGEFIFAHYADIRKLLYDTAIEHGAQVRFGARVSTIDPAARSITLVGGEVIHADVIVGADGPCGKSRQLMDAEEPEPESHNFNLYSTTVPKAAILADPELRGLYEREYTSMSAWFGNGRLALGIPLGGQEDFALNVYGAADGKESRWEDEAPIKGLRKILESSESKLRKLGALARPPSCVAVKDYHDLENWVHESGRMVVIGEAAHPMPAGAIQQTAMAVEDGAVLGKLFSHLRAEDQISNFLYAFEDLRQKRCSAIQKKEFGDIHFMSVPPGDFQQGRDDTLRAKRDAGLNVLDPTPDSESPQEWSEIKDIFGYDAEDEADNWWQEWGLLKEHAVGREVGGEPLGNVVVEHQVGA